MKTEKQLVLRQLVKLRDEFQGMRKRIGNRAGIKADGSPQKVDKRNLHEDIEKIFVDSLKIAIEREKAIEKRLKKELKSIPIWTEWLSKQKGVGEVTAGWILAEYDINIATTVSKLWQYGGLNPGAVRGRKEMVKSKYKPKMGEVVAETTYREKEYVTVLTNEMVRGDRATPGFVLPYNKKLKTVLLGVLAPSFIKQRAFYRTEYYDPYKERLKNNNRLIYNPVVEKMRKDDGKPWNEVSDGHRDSAAKRYMIKMFLKDLYVNWRTVEGLPVRVPYSEEYLDKKHDD